ncbi:MAG: hypothetical protein KDK74_01225 [Cephaloticoccus sp.]|nr:hypothetical protein [Cephaloticoccus sp.]
MSLINNALKKAQRQRTAEAEAVSAGSPSPIRRGKSGLPAQTLILIVAGAAVIVVLSVVATVYLLRPAPLPPPPPAAPAAPMATAVQPAPEIAMPVIKLPEPEPAPVAPAAADTAPITPAATVTATEPAAPEAVAVPPPATAEPARADERIYAFIDNLQVMGVRSSGADSKVLMNDRVYRVNDLVDRTLALRLIQVGPDRLVFEDANGITYTKTF